MTTHTSGNNKKGQAEQHGCKLLVLLKLLPGVSKSSEYFQTLTAGSQEDGKVGEAMKPTRKNPKQHRIKSDIFGIEFHWIACQRELRRNITTSHVSSGFNGKRITTKPRQRL